MVGQIVERMKADQLIRQQQQGSGRPIVALQHEGRQLVAVRNRLFWSSKWKTFPDFLADYMKTILDPAWGNAEIAKPLAERHTIMQWYDAYCRYQQTCIKTPGEVASSEVTGVVACYLGLAYSLYLLDHNVELQQRLVKRLKDPGQFQGAYYETIVANVLIRAGFELALLDEAKRGSRHCEFTAVSKASGKRYWIEAKMRAVAGLLGRTERDGTTDPDPLSKLVTHVADALGKPAEDERIIFVDLNAEMEPPKDKGERPAFMDGMNARLERYERTQLPKGEKAYVIVTNFAFHRRLDKLVTCFAAPFGLGMPEFNRSGLYRHSDWYRQERDHADAIRICEAIESFLRFPSTFDGSLPSEAFGRESSRVLIGETYSFGKEGIVGTVTSATVNEAEKTMYIAIMTPEGVGQIHTQPMTDAELQDYRRHPEAYFGRVQPVSKRADTPQELFKFFMDAHRGLSRDALLQRVAGWPNFAQLKEMGDDDLLAEFCEGMVASFQASEAGRVAASQSRAEPPAGTQPIAE
jgi:hypothetical protein